MKKRNRTLPDTDRGLKMPSVTEAQAEELRVRGFIESHDGTCLDEEEERRRFIQDLYGERKSTLQIGPDGLISDVANPADALRRAAEANVGWDYSAEAKKLYNRADVVLDRLYPAIATPDFQGRLPKVAIGIESLRNRKTLAAYHLVPDSIGLPFKITFNEQHYIDEDGQRIWRYGERSQNGNARSRTRPPLAANARQGTLHQKVRSHTQQRIH